MDAIGCFRSSGTPRVGAHAIIRLHAAKPRLREEEGGLPSCGLLYGGPYRPSSIHEEPVSHFSTEGELLQGMDSISTGFLFRFVFFRYLSLEEEGLMADL